MLNAVIIGEKIAALRREHGLSQAQLAEHLNLSPQAVSKWERGESLPDLITLDQLCSILEVDLNYFSGQPATGENPAEEEKITEKKAEETKEENEDAFQASSVFPACRLARGWAAPRWSGSGSLVPACKTRPCALVRARTVLLLTPIWQA